MHDPLRIPGVLDAVRRVWEGQPELSLPTLFAMLANRGVGWGVSDVDLVRELEAMARVHPGELPLLDARVTARHLILTEDPAHRVMVDPWRVIVRRPGVSAQPGVWPYARLRPTFVGSPLVISSAEGIDHRLGVVTRITLLDDAPRATVLSLTGVERRERGDDVHLVTLADDSVVLLSHGFEHFIPARRELTQLTRPWEKLVECAPGRPLRIAPPGGAAPVDLADVGEILVVEGPPAS
ncbi:MAG: hypothetical protein Q4G50_14350 [Corynebacterium sp.]|uniref:hypothetical protein n=1 Tax=Corynebacterium sp. TaxID=1720 RepID=UPI0026E0DCD3|nr:hypothetical protein [Corynebacterium sp.]MDO5671168.1 hypothetical protein [Corynebacterium sp.]